MFKNKSIFCGITLIELLIALTLSLLVLAMLTTIYISTEKNLQAQNALTAIAENARTAIGMIRADLKNAGNIGCGRLQDGFPVAGVSAEYLSVLADRITVRAASTQHAVLLQDMVNPSMLMMSAKPHFKVGDTVIVSNCMGGEIFSVLFVSANGISQTITASHVLAHRFLKNAVVSLWLDKTYFVESGALYVKNNGKYKQEIVRGVSSMEVSLPDAAGVLVKLTLTQDKLVKEWFIYEKIR